MEQHRFFDCTPNPNQRLALEEAARRVISSGVYVGGEEVQKFEEDFARMHGGGYCVAVGNGLDALTLGLLALGIGPGDDVLVPSYTFMATWIAVKRVGARALPVDIDSSTGLIDLERIKEKVNRRVKALIPVHLYGSPVDLGPILDYLRNRHIAIVEDCAQAVGATIGGSLVGSIGAVGAFSFYPTKNLGALGDAGAILVQSEDLAEKLRSLRSYGFGKSRYDFDYLGINSRLDSLQAAFLRSKLQNLTFENTHRQRQAKIYLENFDRSGLRIQAVTPGTSSVYHHFAIRHKYRDEVRNKLIERGVESDMHYPYTFEAFSRIANRRDYKVRESDLTGARDLASSIITLPIGSWMDINTTEKVAYLVSETLSKFDKK